MDRNGGADRGSLHGAGIGSEQRARARAPAADAEEQLRQLPYVADLLCETLPNKVSETNAALFWKREALHAEFPPGAARDAHWLGVVQDQRDIAPSNGSRWLPWHAKVACRKSRKCLASRLTPGSMLAIPSTSVPS